MQNLFFPPCSVRQHLTPQANLHVKVKAAKDQLKTLNGFSVLYPETETYAVLYYNTLQSMTI